MKTLLLALIPFLLVTLPVYAAEEKKEEPKAEENVKTGEVQDKPENPARFAPDFCDFEITFPEAPAIAQNCVNDNACYEVHSYTMVYDLQTTVDISATCSPSTPAAYKNYNDQVMKAALYGMVDNRNLSTHDMNFNEVEKGKIKSASLTGAGITGSQNKIYTGQLWIGPNSVFTVQAELVGDAHPDADKSFSDILRSIKTKEGKQVPKEKKSKSNIPAKEKNE